MAGQDRSTSEKDGFAGPARATDQTRSVLDLAGSGSVGSTTKVFLPLLEPGTDDETIHLQAAEIMTESPITR